MTQHRQSLGKSGENLAVGELTARGYAILARRYRTRHGEIDIIAEHEGTIVFVEVRARATAECGRAAETVTGVKKRKVTAMAVDYLARHHITNRPCRFDVVAIDQALSPSPEITVYPNAFDAAEDLLS
jgi:putative endonuclease